MEKVLGKVQGTVTGSLRPQDRASPGCALAGKDSGIVLTGEFLVHSIKVSDLAAAYAYVTGRNVLVRTYALPQFKHKCLAETHNLVIRLAYRVKVRTSLGAAHRQGCKGIFEGLLKTEELEHRRGDCPVEPQTSLVRADGAIELDAVTCVGLHFALVVNPGHTEGEDTVRLDHSLHDLGLLELGMLVVNFLN